MLFVIKLIRNNFKRDKKAKYRKFVDFIYLSFDRRFCNKIKVRLMIDKTRLGFVTIISKFG